MKRAAYYVLIWLVVLWCLAPFLWQIITSLKSNVEIAALPVTYIPHQITTDHYEALFVRKPFARYLLNSFIISAASTILCVGLSALAAYAVSRLRMRGSRLMLGALVVISLFPPIIFFFPLYEMMRAAGLLNNPLALIIPYTTFNLPFSIIVLATFFRTVPRDIEDAAKVDGLGRLQILWRIILPLSAPALATTALLVFIFAWNEFLFALTFMTNDRMKTVTAGIATLSGTTVHETPWGPIAAAVVVSTMPLILLVGFFQRRIVQGLTAGALKG
ncbi:MAG: carbohydrate ABC transporter permease [Chthoniobacterales bacterium]